MSVITGWSSLSVTRTAAPAGTTTTRVLVGSFMSASSVSSSRTWNDVGVYRRGVEHEGGVMAKNRTPIQGLMRSMWSLGTGPDIVATAYMSFSGILRTGDESAA